LERSGARVDGNEAWAAGRRRDALVRFAGPAVKTSRPRLPPRDAACVVGGCRAWGENPAAEPAEPRLYSYFIGFARVCGSLTSRLPCTSARRLGWRCSEPATESFRWEFCGSGPTRESRERTS